MKSFYDQLEPEIKEAVKLLRDNGFNTTASCGHEMTIELDLVGDMSSLDDLYKLLFNEGHRGFKLSATLQSPPDGFPIYRADIQFTDWR